MKNYWEAAFKKFFEAKSISNKIRAYEVKDDFLNKEGINAGDLLFIDNHSEIEKGDFILTQFGNQINIRKTSKGSTNEGRLIGKVIAILHFL